MTKQEQADAVFKGFACCKMCGTRDSKDGFFGQYSTPYFRVYYTMWSDSDGCTFCTKCIASEPVANRFWWVTGPDDRPGLTTVSPYSADPWYARKNNQPPRPIKYWPLR